MRGVEYAVGVVAGIGGLARPLAAETSQFADQAALRVSQRHAKRFIPGLPHHSKQHGDVHIVERACGVLPAREDLVALLRIAENVLQHLPRLPFLTGNELPARHGGPNRP